MTKITDEWETPQWLFDKLNKEFNFTGDLCANEKNAKSTWFTSDIFWATQWPNDQVFFMNPPYSNPFPFIQKAIEIAFKWDNTVVMLLKCDTSTKWWGLLWDYDKHEPQLRTEIRFLSQRIKFVSPVTKKLENATFPSVVVILNRRTYNLNRKKD